MTGLGLAIGIGRHIKCGAKKDQCDSCVKLLLCRTCSATVATSQGKATNLLHLNAR